jgi:hypothetical protein
VLVESFAENNYTAGLVTRSAGPADRNGQRYWLGLASLDDLRTNTLESAAGLLVSQYAGTYLLLKGFGDYSSNILEFDVCGSVHLGNIYV